MRDRQGNERNHTRPGSDLSRVREKGKVASGGIEPSLMIN